MPDLHSSRISSGKREPSGQLKFFLYHETEAQRKTATDTLQIEEVQKTAPFLENRSLVLLLGKLVIDVLVGDRPGVVVRLHPASAILKHPLHGDGLLRCPGNSGLRRLFLAALTGLFPKRHGLTLLS